MNKIFFALVMLGVVSLSAQEKTTLPQIGVKTGVNMASFNGKNVKNNDYVVGLSAGIYWHIPVTSQFAVQSEINFTRIGGRLEDKIISTRETTVKNKNKITLDYIEVPIMFKYYPAGSRFNIEVGPQVGFNIYAHNNATTTTINHITDNNNPYSNSLPTFSNSAYNDNVVTTRTKRDVQDLFKTFDYGLNFGLGYNITDHVNVGARCYMELKKIAENVNETRETKASIKNHSFSIGVGYSF
jgi:opacity protein-like surface antigen